MVWVVTSLYIQAQLRLAAGRTSTRRAQYIQRVSKPFSLTRFVVYAYMYVLTICPALHCGASRVGEDPC